MRVVHGATTHVPAVSLFLADIVMGRWVLRGGEPSLRVAGAGWDVMPRGSFLVASMVVVREFSPFHAAHFS